MLYYIMLYLFILDGGFEPTNITGGHHPVSRFSMVYLQCMAKFRVKMMIKQWIVVWKQTT